MYFTAKLASLLLALAASARAAVIARTDLAELSVIFWDDVNERGATYSPATLLAGVCQDMPGTWEDRPEALRVGPGYACTFFNDGACTGTAATLSGDVPSLLSSAPPLYNAIESFNCTRLGPS